MPVLVLWWFIQTSVATEIPTNRATPHSHAPKARQRIELRLNTVSTISQAPNAKMANTVAVM